MSVNIDLTEAEKMIANYLNEKSRDVAMQIKRDAKASTAFKDKTGRLRKSIRVKKSKFKDGGHIVLAGGKGARHAHLVEYGHGGPRPAPPRSFLRAALDKNIEDAKRILGVR